MSLILSEDNLHDLKNNVSDILVNKGLEHYNIKISQEIINKCGSNETAVTLQICNGLFKGECSYYAQKSNSDRIALIEKPRNERPIVSSVVYTKFYMDEKDTLFSAAYHMTKNALINLNQRPAPIKRRQPIPKL